MLFFVYHQGKEHRVRIESKNNQMFVSYNDQEEEALDLVYQGRDASFIHQNQVFAANIVGDQGNYVVWRPEGNLQFKIESEYRRLVGLLRGTQLATENNVYAKMPGKITKLQAKVGDVVEQGTPILVMEAMKMENEVRSPTSGTVCKIHVGEGQAVESGQLLVELKID